MSVFVHVPESKSKVPPSAPAADDGALVVGVVDVRANLPSAADDVVDGQGQGVSPGAGEQQGTSVHGITDVGFDQTFDPRTASAADSASHQLHSPATHTHTDVDKGAGAETKIQESRVGEKEDTNLRSISESTNNTKRDNQLATNRDRAKEWEADMSMQSRALHSCEASTCPPPPSQDSRG